MYRFHKFARKHKPALATAAAIAVCLILGTTVSAWQAVRATSAEAQAIANEQKANANEVEAKAAALAEAQQRQRAEANEQKANTQRAEAQRQRDEVKALNEKLLATQAELRETLYAAHMNLARHAWEAGILDQAEELLAQHRPKPGETDLRGFEWYYLYRLCHGELLTLKGHGGGVTSVAYSADGQRLASGSSDATVKVWDTSTGRIILTFSGHTHEVQSVAFSPDGKRIASAGGEQGNPPKPGELKIWDAQTGKEQLSLNGHTGVVSSVTFSLDGKRVASADWVGAIKVWDAQTGKELIHLKSAPGIYNAVFSPDGKRLASIASNDYNGRMTVWDAQTGQELFRSNAYGNLSFSPDGKRLTNGYSVMDAETGKILLSINGLTNARGLLHSPDGKRLAGTSGDKIIRIYDAESGKELFSLK